VENPISRLQTCLPAASEKWKTQTDRWVLTKRNFKRLLVIADTHCGHRVGLTPPQYTTQVIGGKATKKYYKIQVETWDWFTKEVDKLKPIDVLATNGDLIDGTGSRSGGTELITTDIRTQRKMAVESIEHIESPKIIMARGTDYHVSPNGQDAEDLIYDELKKNYKVKIGDHEFFNINGVVFDMKHHIGSTSVPYSRGTAISKDQVFNVLWHDYEEQPRADVLFRAHAHYYFYCGDGSWHGIVLPALQAQGSKYGARRKSGHVDFGFVHFDIYKDGSYTWTPHILRVVSQRATVVKL
jgi:hypothetical protein